MSAKEQCKACDAVEDEPGDFATVTVEGTNIDGTPYVRADGTTEKQTFKMCADCAEEMMADLARLKQ